MTLSVIISLYKLSYVASAIFVIFNRVKILRGFLTFEQFNKVDFILISTGCYKT